MTSFWLDWLAQCETSLQQARLGHKVAGAGVLLFDGEGVSGQIAERVDAAVAAGKQHTAILGDVFFPAPQQDLAATPLQHGEGGKGAVDVEIHSAIAHQRGHALDTGGDHGFHGLAEFTGEIISQRLKALDLAVGLIGNRAEAQGLRPRRGGGAEAE